ncbi:hypothetical protein K402DRAFT_396489, partial [Aulographum hederae CBS 113979]
MFCGIILLVLIIFVGGRRSLLLLRLRGSGSGFGMSDGTGQLFLGEALPGFSPSSSSSSSKSDSTSEPEYLCSRAGQPCSGVEDCG